MLKSRLRSSAAFFPDIEYTPANICFQVPDPPAPPGGGNGPNPPPPAPPPAPDAELPPTPARAPGQSDTERAQQLEGILAEVRAEAAHRRIGKREAESRAAALQNELTSIRTEADRRESAARAEGNTRAEKIKARAVEAEIKAAAVAEGLQDVDLLPLLDRTGVTCDDDGNVSGVAEAVAAFKAKKPDYFRPAAGPAPRPGERVDVRANPLRQAPPQPAPGAQPPAPTSVTAIPRDRAGRQQYDAAKKAALASLR
jgi:hypothetical protein